LCGLSVDEVVAQSRVAVLWLRVRILELEEVDLKLRRVDEEAQTPAMGKLTTLRLQLEVDVRESCQETRLQLHGARSAPAGRAFHPGFGQTDSIETSWDLPQPHLTSWRYLLQHDHSNNLDHSVTYEPLDRSRHRTRRPGTKMSNWMSNL